MNPGKSRFGAALLAAAAGLFVMTGAGEPSSAFAQRQVPGHAKPKNKKPKVQIDPKHPRGAGHGGVAGAGKPHGGAAAAVREAVELKLAIPIQRVTLENGLRVVMNVDHTSPTIAVAVTYDVGSRHEQKGRAGFAHLFEHLMFHGSANLPKGELERLVLGRGGFLSANTYQDFTNYYMALPSNELAAALWAEADRMKSLRVTEESFQAERSVVKEEHRLRVSNAAYGQSGIRLEELVYQGFFPYEHDPIGSMADLDAAKLDWVQEFHARHYGPNTAVLSISGDFEADEAMELVHRYFDGVPRIQAAPFEETALPEQTSQRTAVLHDDHASTPGILYGWAAPPGRHADSYALALAGILLGSGESSRLYHLLVREKGTAKEVSAELAERRGPGLFSIDVKLAENAKAGDVEKVIEGEIKALATRPPTDAEITKARRRAQARLVLGLQWNRDRAIQLGRYEALFGDARHLNNELSKYLAVTKEDVMRVAAQYLGPTRRTIVETYPAPGDPATDAGKSAARGPASAAAAHADSKAAAHSQSKAAAHAHGKKDSAKKSGATSGGAKKKANGNAKAKKKKP